MSMKVSREGNQGVHITGQTRDSYGLPVQDAVSPRKDGGAQPTTPRTQSYGVRVPILKDLDGHYIGKLKHNPCRFDIVERVTTVIKPGSYGPEDAKDTMNSQGREAPDPHGHLSRQPTYHSGVHEDQRVSSVLDKIGPYHWNKYVKSCKESDARDVLYRNTYCLEPELLRYRSLTLPRISTSGNEERPWTVAGEEVTKSVVTKTEHGEYSKIVTIVPQQPRGSVVKFREYMKPYTHTSDDRMLEVKRVSSRQNENKHFTTVKSVFPLIKHDFRRSPKRQERPLKFENARYIKGNKGTLFSKHILPAYKNAFDRDYSSADTFKEYLESLQQAAKSHTPGVNSREMNGYRYYNESKQSTDYHNQVLQSVSDVNQPFVDGKRSQDESSGNQDPMKIEIKSFMKDNVPQKAPTIDNLSSVRGSVIQGRSDSQSHLPISSSVVGGKSVAKPTSVISVKDEQSPINVADKAPSGQNSEHGANSVVSVKSRRPEPVVLPNPNAKTGEEEDMPCPANTPTPDQNQEQP